MAEDTDSLVLSISADVRQVKRALDRLVADSKQAAKAIEAGFNGVGGAADGAVHQIEKIDRAMAASAKKMSSFAGTLKSGIGGLGIGVGAGFAVQQAKEIIDANTRIQNSLKVTGLEGENLDKVYADIAASAQKFGGNFETLAKVYSRVAIVQNELGVSTQQLTTFTDNVAAALKVQGTSAQDAQGPMLQLAQALSTGVVRAEEFNSINEGLPIILKTVANGSDAAGGSIAKLRQIMLAGELTSKDFFAAFERGSNVLQDQAGTAATTLGQAFENMKTSMIVVFNQMDKSTGISTSLAESISKLSEAIAGLGNVVDAVANSQLAGFIKTLSDINAEIRKWLPVYEALGVLNKETLDALAGTIAPTKSLTGAKEALADLNQEVTKVSVGAAKLARELKRSGDEASFQQIHATMLTLTMALADGSASAKQFDDTIAALRATGTDAGEKMARSIERAKTSFDEAMTALAAKISQDVGGAVDGLIVKFRDELPNSMNAAIDKLLEIAKAVNGVGTPLDALLGQFKALAGVLPTLETIAGIPGKLAGASFELGGLTQQAVGTPSIAKDFIKRQATSAAARNDSVDRLNDEFAVKVAKLLAQFPDLKVTEAFRTFDQQAEIRRRHEAMPGGVAAHPAARPGHSRHEKGAAVDLSIGGMSEERIRAVEAEAARLGLANPIRNDRGHFQLSGPGLEDDEKHGAKAKSNLDDWIAKSREAIALKEKENEIDRDSTGTINEKAAAKEREKLIQDGLSAAMEQYGTVTDAQKQKIIDLATAQANLGLVAENTADKQKEAADRVKEQAEAVAQFAEQIGNIAASALSGFISDLRAGKSAGEAFNNMLNKIVDSLIDMAIQSLFSKDAFGALFGGGGGGGGGGILSLISLGGGAFPAAPGGLFEKGGIVGDSRIPTVPANPRHFRGARSYASGGFVGQPPGSVPIYAHPGELVVPKNMVNRANAGPVGGDVTNNIGDVSVDMSSTGLVASSTESGKLFGRQVQDAVRVVLVRESRPGGILRRQGTA